MDVDAGAGVEEAKGEVVPPAGNGAGNKGQKGEGDRNVMLHPVRSSQEDSIVVLLLWLCCMEVIMRVRDRVVHFSKAILQPRSFRFYGAWRMLDGHVCEVFLTSSFGLITILFISIRLRVDYWSGSRSSWTTP